MIVTMGANGSQGEESSVWAGTGGRLSGGGEGKPFSDGEQLGALCKGKGLPWVALSQCLLTGLATLTLANCSRQVVEEKKKKRCSHDTTAK